MVRRFLIASLGSLVALLGSAPFSTPIQAQELLGNGGFELGLTGWSGTGLSPLACQPRSGNGAMGLVVDAGPANAAAVLEQQVAATADGSYQLTGWMRLDSGSAQVRVDLLWLDAGQSTVLAHTGTPAPGSSYGQFSVGAPFRPPGAVALTVRVSAESNAGAVLCLDDLSLDGPPPATPAPTQGLPTSTPIAEPTAAPTSTPAAPVAPATSTPPPAATPLPSLTFINGGFEEGLTGWQKFGGELSVVPGPRHGGQHAGLLVSESSSTKWAYQAVAIDPDLHYEFAGHLLPADAIAGAYLRISWYASGDGSGQAISTTDSTSRIEGASQAFVFLTTGSVRPPETARSARVRAVLAPAGEGPARLYLDDFYFVVAQPPPPTPTAIPATAAPTATPPPTPPPTAAPSATSPPASTAAAPAPPGGDETSAPAVEAPPGDPVAAQAGAVTVSDGPATSAGDAPPTLAVRIEAIRQEPLGEETQLLEAYEAESPGGGVPLPWLLGGALFVIGLGGAYIRGRRSEA